MQQRQEWLIYSLIALLSIAPALIHGHMPGDGADAFGTYWFYDWVRRCVENGWNPSWTADFFYPLGKNIFAHTGNNFIDAIWSIPFQWILGPIHYLPVFECLLMLFNLLCFRALARQIMGETGLFAASILWICNPYVIFELTAGRPTQALTAFLPIALSYLLRLKAQPQWPNILGLGISVAVAGWVYWFNLYFLVFLLTPIALTGLSQHPQKAAFIRGILISASLCLILILPAMLPMISAAQAEHVPGLSKSEGLFSLPNALSNNVSADLHGLYLMERWGAPLITQPAFLLVFLWALWKRPLRGQGFLTALGICLLFAIGPVLRLSESLSINNPPYLFLYHIAPFFERLWFPYRIASGAMVLLCILGGVLIKNRPTIAIILAILSLSGQAWMGLWPLATHDVHPSPLLQAAGTEAGALITLPLRVQHDGLIQQTYHHMPTFGGMGESAALLWPTGYKNWLKEPFIRSLQDACFQSKRIEGPADAQIWQQRGYRWIELRRDLLWVEQQKAHPSQDALSALDATVAALNRLLGPAVAVEGNRVLWDLQQKFIPAPEFQATDARLQDRQWAQDALPDYLQRLEELGRQGGPQGTKTTPSH